MGRTLGALLLLLSCTGGTLDDARVEKLVRAYNAQTIEAYRTSDSRLVENVAAADEARKLAVLIDVNLEMNRNMDAQLLSLVVKNITRPSGKVLVTTEEKWRYTERRIGTGEQIGEVADDEYFIRYQLEELKGRWVVTQTSHAAPPKMSQKEAIGSGTFEDLHGVIATSVPDGGTQP